MLERTMKSKNETLKEVSDVIRKIADMVETEKIDYSSLLENVFNLQIYRDPISISELKNMINLNNIKLVNIIEDDDGKLYEYLYSENDTILMFRIFERFGAFDYNYIEMSQL